MTRIEGQQPQVGVRPEAGVKRFYEPRNDRYDYSRRSDYLEEDTVEFSGKDKDKGEDKGVISSACDAVANATKSFVNLTVNAFARAASEVVVDRAVGKIAGK